MSNELRENETATQANTTTEPVVSSAEEFRKRKQERNNGVPIKLPSGVVVSIRRPSINNLIAQGHVPADVANLLMSGQVSQAQGTQDFAKLVTLQKIVAKHSIAKPKVVDGEADYNVGEISIDDFTDDDLAAILIYVQQGVTDLSKFRSDATG